MNKYIGYGIAIVGLIVALLSFQVGKISALSALTVFKPAYVMIAGIVIIGVGVAMTMMDNKKKVSQSEEEVPIYEGVGKKRKIVGYRKSE